MSFVDNLLNMAKNQSDDYDDYDDYDEYDEEEPKKRSLFGKKKASSDLDDYEEEESPAPARRSQQSGPIRTGNTQSRGVSRSQFAAAEGMEARVVKPTSFTEAQEITDILLSNRMVLLNIEGLNPEIAQRVVDFVSGSCYALNGNYEKISEYVHVITPSGVGLSGDFHGTVPPGTFGAFTAGAAGIQQQQTGMLRSDLPFGG